MYWNTLPLVSENNPCRVEVDSSKLCECSMVFHLICHICSAVVSGSPNLHEPHLISYNIFQVCHSKKVCPLKWWKGKTESHE